MKLDEKLRDATERMSAHMTEYKSVCDAAWQIEIKKRGLTDTLDKYGRDVANTIAKRIRSRIPGMLVGVDVRCSASVDHRDFSVRPYLRIKISGQCRRPMTGEPDDAFGSFNAEWTLHNPTLYRVEAAIKMAVDTARRINSKHQETLP